jgi:hypothetical protein
MSVPEYAINGPEGEDSPLQGQTLTAVTSSGNYPKDSPEWWLARLEKQLAARAQPIDIYESYYDGRHPLAFATEQFKKAFGLQFRAFADNWMQIVVDAVEERLNVEGFRIPGPKVDPSAPTNEPIQELSTGDSQAWDFWQANQMDAGSQLVHTDALVDSEAYVLVGPGDTYPEITGESAQQMVCESAPGSRTQRLAALKKWRDDDGYAYATLYLPTEVYKFISKGKLRSNQVKITWIPRELPNEPWPLPNPIGEVPVVSFSNRPRLVGPPQSEIAQLIPLQNAINKLFLDMMVASEYAGFAQRWATGIEVPTDPETGQPRFDVMKMAMDRFLYTESDTAKFGTLQASDLGNYTNAIAMAIQHLASRSATPAHYFMAHMGNFPSGEALKAAETGLVSKVRNRMRHFGESWEEVMRLAFLAADDKSKAELTRASETIWGDPETRTESQHIDAVVKLSALGVPSEILWEKSGWFSPQDIERMKALIEKGAKVAPLQTPGTPGTGPPGAPGTPGAPVPPTADVGTEPIPAATIHERSIRG